MAKSLTEKIMEKFGGKALDAQQLEDVAGGSLWETRDDSKFLNSLLGDEVCRNMESGDMPWQELKDMVTEAWSRVGIRLGGYGAIRGANYYWSERDNRAVSREEAMRQAQEFLGKQGGGR
ncbi:MAG: hypothetical protein IKZ66_01165 [Schwartzia sp.]|jgi:hypothetical protein|nr:hypothetical protein [Schwartzia sp. (in: firmicutes)]